MNFIKASGFVKKTWRFNHEKGTRHKTQSTGYRAQGVRHKAKDKKEKKIRHQTSAAEHQAKNYQNQKSKYPTQRIRLEPAPLPAKISNTLCLCASVPLSFILIPFHSQLRPASQEALPCRQE
jgi:hypothetical protein